MKKRLFFLTASLIFAVMSFAQPVVTVEKLWSGGVLGWSTSNSRQWAGYGEYVYWADKATHKIFGTHDGQQAETIIENDLIDGVGFCTDDAGNWVVTGPFVNPYIPTHMFLVKHTDTTFVDISISVLAVRTDMISATGNIFSEDGGFIFLYGNSGNLWIAAIKNAGTPEQEVTYKEIAITGSNVQNYVVAGDTTVQYVQRRTTGQTGFDKYVNGVNTGAVAGMTGYKNNTLGGAMVTLSGQVFAIYPSGSKAYSSEFSVVNLTSGQVIGSGYCANTTTAANGSNVGIFATVTKIDEYSAYIQVGNGSDGTALFKLTVPKLYEIGDNNGWAKNPGEEMEMVASGVYEGIFTFNATGDPNHPNPHFTFATVAADDWDGVGNINENRWGAPSDNYYIADGQTVALHWQWANSFEIAPGKYKLTVDVSDLNDPKVSVLKIKADNVYGYTDASGAWVLSGLELTKKADNVFEGEFVLPEAKHILFSKVDADNWGDINNAQIEINSSNDYWVNGNSEATIIEAPLTPGEHPGFLIKGAGKYKFNVNLNTNKIAITQMNAMVEVTAAGYATYYNSEKAYTMPDGMTGYAFNVANGLVEAYTQGQVVPFNTPLVLEAAEGAYTLEWATGGQVKDLASQLHGSDWDSNLADNAEYWFYGLSLDENSTPGSVGFYWMDKKNDPSDPEPSGRAFQNKAHRAYLMVPISGSNAPSRILFNENNATNMQDIDANNQVVKFIENGRILITKEGITYDVMGRVVR